MELLSFAHRILAGAREGEQVDVYVAHTKDSEVEVHGGDVETLSTAESDGVGIRVILPGPDGARQGFAYTGNLDEDAIRETFEAARDNASFATPDPYLGLAVPDGVAPAVLDLWRDGLDAFPTDRKIALALELERAVKAGDPRIRALRSAGYGDALVEAALVTTTGLEATWRRTACSMSAYAIAGEGDDTQTGGGYTVGRHPDELDVAKAVDMTITRATRLLGAKKPASRKATVVFDPQVTATLLAILGGTLNAESVLKGRSLFAGRVGEQVAIPAFTMVEDATDPRAYGASRFDGEGLATRRVPLIDRGVLTQYVHNSVSARRMGGGAASTGSAVRGGFKSTPGIGCRALAIEPGTLGLDAILGSLGDAVFVQSISGVHSGVNTVSGDFSVGAEGLVVRDGVFAEPIREFTIASTIQRMLNEITHIGSDLEWLPASAVGLTLAVGGMSLSGS